jgi:hypothetical protein
MAADGRRFIVEVQQNDQYYFKRRSLLYLSKEFANSVEKRGVI